MQRVKRYQVMDLTRWAGALLLEADDGKWYECYWLKLPSYGYHYQVYMDCDEWSQLVIFWHGRDGLKSFWLPLPQGESHEA